MLWLRITNKEGEYGHDQSMAFRPGGRRGSGACNDVLVESLARTIV
jgi:hypothetical protein